MNRYTLLAAIALVATAAAPAALAQEATPDAWQTFTGTASVAQVQAELAQARASGQLRVTQRGYLDTPPAMATRAEVLASLALARASGELAALNGEASPFASPERVRIASLAR